MGPQVKTQVSLTTCKYFHLQLLHSVLINVYATYFCCCCYEFELLRVQSHLFNHYKWRTENGWLMICTQCHSCQACSWHHRLGQITTFNNHVFATFKHQVLTNYTRNPWKTAVSVFFIPFLSIGLGVPSVGGGLGLGGGGGGVMSCCTCSIYTSWLMESFSLFAGPVPL